MPEPGSSPADTQAQEAGDRARTPLLELVTREALEQDYAAVARRRSARGSPPPRGGHRGAAVGVAVFGLLVAVAAVQTSRHADEDEASRAALIDRIALRRETVDGIEQRIVEQEDANDRLVQRLVGLASSTTDAARRRDALALETGFVAVSGPGLRVTVDDQPQGDPDGRVRATDLRLLVNGLWEAGADAIAVNGRRLTAASAIVNSDIAIQVNKGPLSPPYVVQAIGGQNLEADLVETDSGLTFLALAEQFGFVVDRDSVSSLQLPAAPTSLRQLRYVQRPPGPRDVEEGKNQ